jgi:outer membrane receptor protein involved in Fe transport
VRTVVSATALAAGILTTVAWAQNPAQNAASVPDELTEITVTGSRVVTNGNDAPTPVTVVSPDQLTATRPTTVFQNLASLPMFSGSIGTAQPPDNDPTVANTVSALNLRNLGPLRALVLFDGHRVPPTSATGLVDINIMPQMLLQRVDVVTGGASAVYGSDAVTGVINFILDRKFNGVKVDLERGVSSRNDDYSYRVGLAGGTDLFDGRGHIEASVERNNDNGILWREQRNWSDALNTLEGSGTASAPYRIVPGVHINNVTFGGVITCPFGPSVQALCPGLPLVGYEFANNGVLTPEIKPDRSQIGGNAGLNAAFLQIGGGGGYQIGASLKAASRQDQAFSRFDYDLTDDLHAFITGSMITDTTFGYGSNLRSFPPGWNIGACNAFLASQYQLALGCTNQSDPNQPTFTLDKMWNPDLTNGFAQANEVWVHNYFVMTGLEGKFGNGFHWDATYTHSEASTNVRGDTNNNLAKTYAALDAVVAPNGQIVCNVTLTNPGLYPGCVPLNLFGPTAASPQSLAYILGRIETTVQNKMDGLEGTVRGEPLNDWAGPVGAALSGEVRRESLEMSSNSLPTNFIDCTPLRFGNCSPPDATGANGSTYFINTFAPRSPVHQTVAEAAVEFNVPLLKELPFAKSLSSDDGFRFTRYSNSSGGDPLAPSTSFNANTWKLGLTWTATDWLTVRWARSRDIRAPNLWDLYQPIQVIPNQIFSDYLPTLSGGAPADVTASQQTGGNPYLKPEVANTTTLGLVLKPTDNFNMAIDGYDISIRDALATIDGSTSQSQLACYTSGGTSPLCALIVRDANNTLTKTIAEAVNVAVQKTWGIDFEANYSARLLDRALSLRALLNYQPHLIYSQIGLPNHDQAGVAYNSTFGLYPSPVWKATAFLHYDATESLGIDLGERYRSSLAWTRDPIIADNPDYQNYAIGGVAAVAYTDATLTYTLHPGSSLVSVFLNCQNVFNKDPPPAGVPGSIFPGISPNGYAVGDDVVGRYWTLGLKATL